jgi:hypothetical protein
MKRIKVDITYQEYQDLQRIAESAKTSVANLVGAFIQDLTYSDRSGGSDERELAREWLGRNVYRVW